MKKFQVCFGLAVLVGVTASNAQVLLSGGLTYSQDFDSLASSGTSVPWADNSTLPGWYASRATTTSGGVYGPYPYTTYRVSGGELNTGSIYSFGTNGVGLITDRALGSISSGTPATNAFGLRLRNDTTMILGDVFVSYTGEQWRNGGNTSVQYMNFTYQVSANPITDPTPGNESPWTAFAGLTFATPTVGATATFLDGNDALNRTAFSNILLPVTLNPGEELFIRWYDINDTGNDHGFGVDNFSIAFAQVPEPSAFALFGLGFVTWLIRRRR
jgi:uncharacterized protein